MSGPGEATRSKETANEHQTLPDIQINDRPLRTVGQQALAALTRRNDRLRVPRLYVQGGEPVRVKRSESGELGIQDLSLDITQYELTRSADFIRVPKKGDPEDVYPPATWPAMSFRPPDGRCQRSRA